MKEAFKRNEVMYTFIFIIVFIIGLMIGMVFEGAKIQSNRIEELEKRNDEMYQELIIKRDILNQIQMRNEAIKFMDDVEE